MVFRLARRWRTATCLARDPDAALRRLVASSWRIVDRYRSVIAAAEHELPAG